jgi:hypothetical protein
MVKRRALAGDNQDFLPFLNISAAGDPQPSGPRSGSDKPLAVPSVHPEDIEAEIRQLEQALEAETRKFEKRVAKDRKRLVVLKRARAGRLAAKASAAARAPGDAAEIRARWRELGGGRGHTRPTSRRSARSSAIAARPRRRATMWLAI